VSEAGDGDSGGPIFYQDPAIGPVEVSLVSGGDFPCRATNTGPGLSQPKALDFIHRGMVVGDLSAVIACVDRVLGS
jgi:hypothetical protein